MDGPTISTVQRMRPVHSLPSEDESSPEALMAANSNDLLSQGMEHPDGIQIGDDQAIMMAESQMMPSFNHNESD